MTNLTQGWQAYHRGSYDQALRHFGSADSESAAAGRALSLVATGRGNEAASLVRQQLQRSASPFLRTLLADVLGRQGNRSEAERILRSGPRGRQLQGFQRSLLGEQRLRQGRWDDGTDDFIAALNQRDQRTFPHVQRVVADMVDAVAARRIPRQDALRFINRIDYSTSDKTQAMNSFFASARRALNANRRVDRKGLVEPWSVGVADEDSPPSRSRSNNRARSSNRSRRPRSSGPPRRRQSNRRSSRQHAPTPVQQTNGGQSRRSSSRVEVADEMQRRLTERPSQAPKKPDLLMEAKQRDMTDYMQRDRRRNEDLQALVAAVSPPSWPSEQEEAIDFIEPIGFAPRAIIRGSQAIETANFRITGGDISVQVTLERCMHNLLAAALATKPITLPLELPSIARLEFNLLDDFLSAMPGLDELYRKEHNVSDQIPLAIGKFIGECIVQSYGGVWDYDQQPEKSVIHLGDHILDPIGLAEKFLDADDFDSVTLREVIHEAEVAVDTSTTIPSFADYLDPTSGLEKEGLAMSLAELWVDYRFVVPDQILPDVAASLQVVEQTPKFVVFTIGSAYAPEVISKYVDGSVDEQGRIALGYLRDTGEFLLLPSRKHFARFMVEGRLDLGRKTAQAVSRLLDRFFRPGWVVATSSSEADQIKRKFGDESYKPPAFRSESGQMDLRVHAVDEKRKRRVIHVQFRPGEVDPYEVRVR